MSGTKDNSEFTAIETYNLDEVDKLNSLTGHLSHICDTLEQALAQKESKETVGGLLADLDEAMNSVSQQATLALVPVGLAQPNLEPGPADVPAPGGAKKKDDKSFYQDDDIDSDDNNDTDE